MTLDCSESAVFTATVVAPLPPLALTKIFTNVNCTVVDPKSFDERSFVTPLAVF